MKGALNLTNAPFYISLCLGRDNLLTIQDECIIIQNNAYLYNMIYNLLTIKVLCR